MPEQFLDALHENFGTTAAIVAVVVFFTAVPFCIRKRQWPDTGALVLLLLSTVGALSGIKITMLTLLLPPTQLGPLADDKGALIIGGLATLTLSLKEAVASWRKLTGI